MVRLMLLAPLAFVALACASHDVKAHDRAGPSVVRLERVAGGFRLLLNGEPYLIKGVGGTGSRTLLLQLGANSIRTWGADDLGAVLDQAYKDGLTVTAGIWLGHADVFDYSDAEKVAKQKAMCREVIEKHKDHPALLLWAFGNEMEAYGEADDPAVWRAVNDIAAMSKQIDPHHPTMTVIAEIGGQRVPNIERYCPAIDVVGVNSYGGAPSLVERYRKAGGTKPFVLTEFGPPGSWERPKTDWAAPVEPTSTEKAAHYRTSYEAAVSGAGGLSLGSYAFLWGHKQEATATWFGMLLKDGSRVEAADVMTEFWTGKPPANRCPTIANLAVSKTHPLKPGETIEATLKASDPEGDALTVRWVLSGEVAKYLTAGRDEAVPDDYPGAILRSQPASASVKMPAFGGKFRLFVYVTDAHGGAAVANVPLFIDGPEPKSDAPMAKLPVAVYTESDAPMPFAPSGWMGDVGSLAMDLASANQPHGGKTCIQIDFKRGGGWGGVAWQHPADDWGDKPGSVNLTGAVRLVFWMRGDKGGETVKVEFGLIGKDKPYPDSASGKLEAVLTREWKQYSIDLKGKDLSHIKTGLSIVVAGSNVPQRFYLDDIRYE